MTDTIEPVTDTGTDNTGNGDKATRSTRTWSIQGQRIGSEEWEVVAEGLTKGGMEAYIAKTAPLLRRLYRRLRPVKVRVGQVVDL